ncbi:GEVED domain-containing protein, partial [Streptococcus marmotae]
MFKRKKDRFSIRKFKIGVGSVFLGSLLLVAPQVYADTGEVVEGTPASENTTLELPTNKEEINTEKLEDVSPSSTTTSVRDKVAVDKKVLLDEVAEFEKIKDTDQYVHATNKDSYDQELSRAQAILEKEEAPQEEINQVAASLAQARQALDGVAPVEEVERVAATIYKVAYTDQESGKEVYSASHSVAEKTTLPIDQPKEFHVTVDAKTDLKIQPALQGYKLAENQAETQAALVVERGGRNNLVNFNVVRDDQAAAGNNDIEGHTGFRTIPAEKTPEENIEKLYNPSTAETAKLYEEEAAKDVSSLKAQLNWLDWGDPSAAHNLDGDKLKVGSYYEKEIYPGYVVRVEVVGLKPFNASDTYKKRVEGTEAESTYDPNAINNQAGNKNIPKEVIVKPQNGYSNLLQQGLNAGNKPTIGANGNGGNIGVQFKLKATYLGKEVPANFFLATGEEARGNEAEIFVTDGEPFELLAELSEGKTKGSYFPATDQKDNGGLNDLIRKLKAQPNPEGYEVKYLANVNPEKSRIGIATTLDGKQVVFGDGIGTRVAGPNVTERWRRSVPLIVSRNAKTAELYIISNGQQSLMMGVAVFDEGDAPESYGPVAHMISDKVVQPYLGSKKADLDITDPSNLKVDFETDDLFNTGDEGVRQLVGEDKVHRTGSGKETYILHKAHDKTYTLEFKASNGAEASDAEQPTAYAYAWADFNNNGKFDEGERSELVTVNNATGDYQFTWNNVPQMVDPSVRKVAVRARIAKNQNDIAKPTGIAYSGEVEDFQVQVTHPPRGDKEETKGYVGEKQTINVEYIVGGTNPVKDTSGNGRVEFTAYGRQDYDFDTDNLIEDSAEVKIVAPNGDLVDSWKEPGQGTYTIEGKKITFTPEVTFTGKAKGVVLRVTDKNGASTGWEAADRNASETKLENVNNGSHTIETKTMDAVYIPEVINNKPKGKPAETEGPQGVAQTTDAKAMFKEYTTDDQGAPTDTVTDKESLKLDSLTLLNASGEPTTSVTVDGQGTYTLADGVIKFQPLPTFTGTATPVKVRIADASGDQAETTYTPTVKPIKPTAVESTTSGIQGAKQTSPIVFGDDSQPNSVNFKAGAESAPIDKSTITLLNAEGEPATSVEAVDETGKKVGTYKLDGETVVFTPNKDFVGTPVAVTVQAKDANGTPVTTTYTPTVEGVTPTGKDDTSTGKQGQPQEGTPTFTEGDPAVPVNISAENPAKFIDPTTGEP